MKYRTMITGSGIPISHNKPPLSIELFPCFYGRGNNAACTSWFRKVASGIGAAQDRVEQHIHTRRGIGRLDMLSLVVTDAIPARRE